MKLGKVKVEILPCAHKRKPTFGRTEAMAFVLLDMNQVRGEVVQYSFGRGHLTHPAGLDSFHNTLLLDLLVDSVSLDITKGDHTRSVCWSLEHPLLPQTNSTCLVDRQHGHFEVEMPRGPLYGSLRLVASDAHSNTTYIVHILRVGTAVNVSLSGRFSPELKALRWVPFHEERRMSYHIDHPAWYVPDIDMTQNVTIGVQMRPIVYAPLSPYKSLSLPQIGADCQCGREIAGFGDECEARTLVQVQNRQACITVTMATTSVEIPEGEAGVAGMDSDIVQWLQNVNVSGKYVGYSEADAARGSIVSFQATNFSSRDVGATFSGLIPAQTLAVGVTLLLSSTEDFTDAEASQMGITVVAHAPPLSLNIGLGYDAFLLPAFDVMDLHPSYALCGPHSQEVADALANKRLWPNVSVTPSDSRFRVSVELQEGEVSCQGRERDRRLLLKVHRVSDESCQRWCSQYRPRAGKHDVSISISITSCLKEAIELDDTVALSTIAKLQTASGTGAALWKW